MDNTSTTSFDELKDSLSAHKKEGSLSGAESEAITSYDWLPNETEKEHKRRRDIDRFLASIFGKDGIAMEKLQSSINNRGLEVDLDKIVQLYELYMQVKKEVEGINRARNKLSDSRKPIKKRREKGKQLKVQLKEKADEFRMLQKKLYGKAREIPNVILPDVPKGKSEEENRFVKKWGSLPGFGYPPKNHIELGEFLNLVDIDRAAKVSGARFAYLKNEAVLLEFALVNFAIEVLSSEGFTPIVPPVLVKQGTMEGMGYMEHMGNEDFYYVHGAHEDPLEGEDAYYLVGTAEQSIGPMHMGEVFDKNQLPKRYVGFSTSFRREAGSYGKDTRGILRVHQFDKVEMFSFTDPEKSDEEHDLLLELQEKLFQALEIPYRVMKMCTGDLGAPAARKYDVEAWIPTQEKYREVTSTSNTTDFQARRLDIKYKYGDKLEYVHMLNGTAFAIGRTIIAILENYQKKDGTVEVPEVLRDWVGKDTISPDKSES